MKPLRIYRDGIKNFGQFDSMIDLHETLVAEQWRLLTNGNFAPEAQILGSRRQCLPDGKRINLFLITSLLLRLRWGSMEFLT